MWGVPWLGGTLAGGRATLYPAGGEVPTSVVSKLQLSSSAVSWPYIAFCPMELWVMLQSIMGVKKKKNYGMGTPPPPWTDKWMDRHVSKHYLPVVLRTRAVIMFWSHPICSVTQHSTYRISSLFFQELWLFDPWCTRTNWKLFRRRTRCIMQTKRLHDADSRGSGTKIIQWKISNVLTKLLIPVRCWNTAIG